MKNGCPEFIIENTLKGIDFEILQVWLANNCIYIQNEKGEFVLPKITDLKQMVVECLEEFYQKANDCKIYGQMYPSKIHNKLFGEDSCFSGFILEDIEGFEKYSVDYSIEYGSTNGTTIRATFFEDLLRMTSQN